MKSTGFTGLLTLLFIGFKLSNLIDWSWIWVLSPIWICAVLFIIFFVLMAYPQKNVKKGKKL